MFQSIATPERTTSRIPLAVKIAFSGFMAILIPVYWFNYGPTNFLYFCDIALFLTLWAILSEDQLAASMAAVGILIPQFFWCVDFIFELSGNPLSGMTSYMMDQKKSLFLRGLSLFHGWLPFLLVFLVMRLGYNKKGLYYWTGLAWCVCVVAFFFLPPAGAVVEDPNTPINVNYVFGLDDKQPQVWMSAGLYLIFWMLALFGMIFLPTHILLKKFFSTP